MNKGEIQNLIKEILEKMSITISKISVDEDRPAKLGPNADKTTWFSVEVGQPHFFYDRGGEALSALNHLIRRIVENKNPRTKLELEPSGDSHTEEGLGILVDVNGFQKKRIENIHAVAYMMAERARYFKSNIEIDPMSSFERRLVHEFLSNETDLKTESEGQGISRRVVIKYIGAI
ncbi:MAG: R3H domain-containing nucleic acid-binding protein [Patescibacteria group bacterium]